MADYRDIIAGTIGGLMDKVKEVKDSGMIKDVYEHGAERAKAYGRVAKLTLDLNGETEELKRVYAEIGRLYYSETKDAPEGYFVPLFEQATRIIDSIEEKKATIKSMKESFEQDKDAESKPFAVDIDVDIDNFEDVVEETENDGISLTIEIEKDEQ